MSMFVKKTNSRYMEDVGEHFNKVLSERRVLSDIVICARLIERYSVGVPKC